MAITNSITKGLKELKCQLKEKEPLISNLRNDLSLINSRTDSSFDIKEKVTNTPSEEGVLQSFTKENLDTMEEEKLSTRYEELVSESITLTKSIDKVNNFCNTNKDSSEVEQLREQNEEIIFEREELRRHIKSLIAKLKKYESDSSFLVCLVRKRID